MTVGMEIESVGDMNVGHIGEILEKMGNWNSKSDGSIDCSGYEESSEIISPVLSSKERDVTNEIRNICAMLNYSGQHTNNSCGGHIHIGANYLKNTRAWQNLIDIWGNTEYVIYIISNTEGEIPRNAVKHYAKPISRDLENSINNGTINLIDEQDLKEFKELLANQWPVKYNGINFCNLVFKEKHTIEFRVPNGTINADTWIENINLFAALVKASQILADIQERNESQIDKKDGELIECFERLKTENLEEEQKLELLLKVTMFEETEEIKDIYKKRYKTNSELMKKQHYLNESIKSGTAQKGISIGKIAKKVFLGADAVTAKELEMAEHNINSNLDRKKSERM